MFVTRIFELEDAKCRVWDTWIRKDVDDTLPVHFTLLEGELKGRFDREVGEEMNNG